MKTLRFENLIDTSTGKTVEIEMPDDFDENDPMSMAAGARGKAFAERINKVTSHLREVESLEEVGRLGGESGQKLAEMFSNYGFGKHD